MTTSTPHCTIEEVVDEPAPFDPTQFDKELGNLLIKGCDGDTSKFLQVAFGFLKRKTNFTKTEDPAKRVAEAWKEVAGDGKAVKSGFFGKPAGGSAAAASATPGAAPAPKPAPAPAPPAPEVPAPAPAPAAPAPDASGASSSANPGPAEEALPDEEEPESKGIKPNDGRGADFENWSWTQTLQEVTVTVKVPKGTKAKMLDVVIKKDRLKVGIKGSDPILQGELSEGIKADDCMWAMEGGDVEISLTKQDGMHWWSKVLKSDPEIDTQKVEPENSKLSDLDAETRQTVEKMMFDQRQKAMGLPSSDEMKREEMMKKFMAAHPEMDFSQAKMM